MTTIILTILIILLTFIKKINDDRIKTTKTLKTTSKV